MGDKHGPIPAGGVCLLLLDSAQGKPIQTWRFTDQREITIGREAGRDVVISDPHVSRHHVTLFAGDECWSLVSCGRHGTLIDDRLVVEALLRPGMVFRLGPTGPTLRFDQGEREFGQSMTMDHIDVDALALFELDQERSQQEADRIASGELFDTLLQESQRMRSARKRVGHVGLDVIQNAAQRRPPTLERRLLAKIISTHSFRGGTGKSNTTANLSVLVARAGHRVGVIDTDIQSPGIHVIFQLPESRVGHALNDYLYGKCSIEDAAYDVTDSAIGTAEPTTGRPRVFLIPSSVSVGEIGKVLKEGYDVAKLNDGFQRLIKDLELDYLFIDTHPGVNEETLLSIAISDTLILVMRPDSQDFQGTAVTAELARRLGIPEMLILINKVPPNMDTVQLRERVEKAYGAEVVAMLPMNYEIVRLASSGIFVNRFPEHPMTLALKQVAERVMA